MAPDRTTDPFSPEAATARSVPSQGSKGARLRLIAMGLTIVACLCVGFLLTISVVGQLRQSRDQKVAFDDFRYDLANGTAPVAQVSLEGVQAPLGATMGVMSIPSIGLRQVVFNGTTAGVMVSGPGLRRDSYLPGQAGTSIIYGRRAAFGGPFGSIDTLAPGAAIVVTTGQGDAGYVVVAVRRAGDPIPPPAKIGRLTLITADGSPYAPSGLLIVDADLDTEPQPADPPLPRAAMEAAELPLAGDYSAWIGVLLWAQAALVVAVLVTLAWVRWNRWEAWVIGVPIMLAVGIALSAHVALLMPNLM